MSAAWLVLMRTMRTVRILVIALLVGSNVSLAWTLQSSERLGESPVSHVKKLVEGARPVLLHLVFFDSKSCGLEVIDHPFADGTDLAAAMRAHDCLAGVNGNYFQPDRTPLGLVISNGRLLHPLQKARLLSGLLVVTPGRVSLLRAAEYRPNAWITQALQAGPFLIDHGKAVPGLESQREAERTAFLSDGRDHCALLVSAPVTLAELSQILGTPGIVGELKIQRALNFDGGSSSGLWVKDPPFYLPEISAVRNYLGVVEK